MSRRPSTGSRRWSLGRLGTIDRDRLASAVVLAGTVLAAVAALFGGFFPVSGVLVGPLYLFALLLPVAGLALVVVALRWARDAGRSRGSPLFRGEPPESGITRTEHRVGRDADRLLDGAANERYRCRRGDSTEEVFQRLVEGAVRTLEAKRGLAHDAALEAIRTGTWTDDPIAAAFLADERRQPLRERARAAIDPGAAYDRRVRRTLDAIEAIDGRTRRSGLEDVDADERAESGRGADEGGSGRAPNRRELEPEVEG